MDQIHDEKRQITEIEGLAVQAAGQLDEADWKGGWRGEREISPAENEELRRR